MKEFQNEGELIDSSRISVVIQGLTQYVKNDQKCAFYQCIHSIRTHLPNAEIIVSTWKNQDCDESVVDRVIYLDEPASITSDHMEDFKWNFNKMVVSTKNGIIVSNREYVLKFRSDLSLLGTNFFRINRKENIPENLTNFRIFQNPVNISNIFLKSPFSYHHFLFHLSDIVHFGKKEDLFDLWNRVLLDKSTLKHPVSSWSFFNHYSYLGIRMCPEQALMIGWLNSHGHSIDLPYATYISKKGLYLSELSLSLNFNLLDWNQTDILFPARFLCDPVVLKKYIYKTQELNFLYQDYDHSRLNKRFFIALKNAYFDKFFTMVFWSLLCREFLLAILSPKLYYALRKKWRIATNKKN